MPVQIKDAPGGAPQLFWNALTSTSNNLGLSQLWAVEILQDDLRDIGEQVQKLDGYDDLFWNIKKNHNKIHSNNWFLGGTYFLMAQGITFPGEGLNVSREGVGQTGAIKGLIGNNRNDPEEVSINFLETNNSVTDTIFRPWSILAGYKSLKYNPIRKNIRLTCFQKTGTHESMKIRKQVTLRGAVPVTIDSEEYNYTGDRVVTRSVKFAYNHYYVSDREVVDQLQGDAEAYLAYAGDGGRGGLLGALDSIINIGDNIVGSANRLYSDVKGKADRLQAGSTRFLRLIGEDETADRVDNAFNDAHADVGRPVGDVIKTGGDYVQAGRAGVAITREVVQLNGNAQQRFEADLDAFKKQQAAAQVNSTGNNP